MGAGDLTAGDAATGTAVGAAAGSASMGDAAPPAVLAQGLTKRYGGRAVVCGVDLAVAPGHMFGLLGPDGAGKTTTLRCLGGVLGFDAGRVAICGRDVRLHADAVKLAVGYLGQRAAIYEDLTTLENMAFFADMYGVPRREQGARIGELLGLVRLTAHARRLAGTLSGGMRQKLGIACGLLHRPAVLLLDEPTTGIDPVSRRELWLLLGRLRAGGTAVVVATAYIDEADACDEVAFMVSGRIVERGSPDELRVRAGRSVIQVRVAPDRALAARRVVEALDAVEAAVVLGDRVRATVRPAANAALEAQARGIEAALVAAGVAVREARPAPVTLEDILTWHLTAMSRGSQAGDAGGGGANGGGG
jgi:ABC-2 type transport system ATP-binding protein